MGPHTTDEATGGEADSPRPDTHPPALHPRGCWGRRRRARRRGRMGAGVGGWRGAETSEGQARSKGNVLLTGKLCL